MDIGLILRELGGGVSSIVIVFLGWAVRVLWQRNNELNDARVSDQKEHATQIIENTRALESAIRFVEGRHEGQ